MSLQLVTAGESHGPALVAILTGLPAGLRLDRDAIHADLRRRREGYGRSPRQKLEEDEVDVLAGLRHGVTLGSPLALLIRNKDHESWEWGMSPWAPEGEPAGKGSAPVTLPPRIVRNSARNSPIDAPVTSARTAALAHSVPTSRPGT